jgi:hypothetical protein
VRVCAADYRLVVELALDVVGDHRRVRVEVDRRFVGHREAQADKAIT